jgi:hypothetical protein
VIGIVGAGDFGKRRQEGMGCRKRTKKAYRHREVVLAVSCERRREVVNAMDMDMDMVGFVVIPGKERLGFLLPEAISISSRYRIHI